MKIEYFILLSIIGSGVGSLFMKLANVAMHPIIVLSISLLLYVILLPLCFIFLKFDYTVSINGIIYSLLGALFMCSGSLAFYYALHNGGEVGTSAALTALSPALTLVLSYWFLGEPLSIKKLIGIFFAIIGCVILSR